MGRKVPVLALQTGEWRGIANGAIAEPEQAFGYVSPSLILTGKYSGADGKVH